MPHCNYKGRRFLYFSRIVAKSSVYISLFREHEDRANDMDTIEYVAFRYDTAEVENGL